MGNTEYLKRSLGGNAIGPEKTKSVAKEPKADISRRCEEACMSHDPDTEDVALSDRLLKELDHPDGLGDTYAHEQVISAYRRIEELFGGKGPTRLWLPGLFPNWKNLCMRMKSMDYPKVWSSQDPLFIGSLKWGAYVLRGAFKTAMDCEVRYDRDLRIMADDDARTVFEVDEENGIEYSKSPGADDVFVEFDTRREEDEAVFQKRQEAVREWMRRNGMEIVWRWYDNGKEEVVSHFRAVKGTKGQVKVDDGPWAHRKPETGRRRAEKKRSVITAVLWHVPELALAAFVGYLVWKHWDVVLNLLTR